MTDEPASKTVLLICPNCGNRYDMPGYQPGRRYRCGDCKTYLQPASAGQPVPAAQAIPMGGASAQKGKPADPHLGKTYGNYRVTRRIGKGGMGAVYHAEREEDGKSAAVKILGEQFSSDEKVVKRFKREAMTAHRLKHPGIVQVFSAGRSGRHFYIVSELVEGPSLEERIIKEGKMSPEETVSVMSQVMEGLQCAHDQGVAHRDIKPANVLLSKEGRAKLIDFGLAKDEDAQTVLTMVGNVMGTPSYMSPEQAQGERGGPMSDLYACGVMTFLMLTGRRPFDSKKLMEVLNMHVNEPAPSICERVPEVPAALEATVHRLMAKDPHKRFTSPKEAAEALRGGLKGVMPPAEPSSVMLKAKSAVLNVGTKMRRKSPVAALAQGKEVTEASGGSLWWLWLLLVLLGAGAGVFFLLKILG